MDHGEAQYMNLSEGNGVNLALGNDAVAIDWKKWDAILVYPIVATLFFSVLGVVTNIANIVVFIKMGLRETTTISMLALAVPDLLCCLLSLWTYMCYLPAFRDLPSLPFEPSEISSETGVNVRAYLTRTGALITAFITLERCLCVVVPMKVKNIITVPVTRISIVTIYAVTVLPYIAHTFQVKLDWKYYPHLNRTRLGAIYLNNPIVSAVIQVNSYICGFFYLLFASIVIFVCTLFLGITLTRSSRWRESVRKPTQTSSVKSADQKTSGSRKEVRLIKMVVAIATLFIICHIPVTCGKMDFKLEKAEELKIGTQNRRAQIGLKTLNFEAK
ncbi:chemosensory receptor a [Plakobranchus ocellatus]|uniref:Chemosensory receptor a n=1 Tax=Plakobranchus ocellatus TaxID=259542 RepID=A0AAV4AE28_9GAST|nr:chemosensory receptor a [Plakobranchus ocellatus]